MTPATINDSKTSAIIVNEILMLPRRGVHFLVEGATDSKFWEKFIDPETVDMVHCEGRVQLLGAVDIWRQRDRPDIRILGIYDKDYDELSGCGLRYPDYLTRTDYNDLEVGLVVSEALNAVLHEFADDALVAAFEQRNTRSVVNHVEQLSREFGKLRFLNLRHQLNVSFSKLSPHRFVSKEDWHLDCPALHQAFCQEANLGLMQLFAMLMDNCTCSNLWAYSQGHDTLRILAIGLRCVIGQHQRDEADLAGELRLAYTRETLEQTAMFASLQEKGKRMGLSLFCESRINRPTLP